MTICITRTKDYAALAIILPQRCTRLLQIQTTKSHLYSISKIKIQQKGADLQIVDDKNCMLIW